MNEAERIMVNLITIVRLVNQNPSAETGTPRGSWRIATNEHR